MPVETAVTHPPAPKRQILALDGGGVFGFFTIEVLARMEELLRIHFGRPELVLADHFHFVAGTSTGAIIGSFLAWGKSIDWIRENYTEQAPHIFTSTPWYLWHVAKYQHAALAKFLRATFRENDEDALLGSAHLRTLLLVVLRNASTGSVWPVSNNPFGKFSRRVNEDGSPYAECNLNAPLWRVIRASAAAPWYFSPERAQIGNQTHTFVDGGISPYNNPALIAFLNATLPAYGLGWPTGRDRLNLISVGAGRTKTGLGKRSALMPPRIADALLVPSGMLESTAFQQDMICRIFGECRFGDVLDLDLGDLSGPGLFAPEAKLFTYARYNYFFKGDEAAAIRQRYGSLELDNIHLTDKLQELGTEYAKEHVRLDHLL